MSVTALVSLKRENLPAVGRDRVRLLEAVARAGSISAGARAVGLTYRGAWDALEAMANVFSAPLIETRSGGADRGGARLTATGERVIAAFHRLEAEMARLTRDFDAELMGTGVSSRDLVSGFFFKTSARNALRGRVAALRGRALSCEVELALGPSMSIFAEVTRRSVETLGLHVGREAMALIKAPFISVVTTPTGARNRLAGVMRRVEASGEEVEATLDIGQGKTIAALMGADAARGLAEGQPAFACFDAAQVILAID